MKNLPVANGFSLVEVALSLAILSVAMVGVLALLPVGLDSARQVHAEAVAVQVVRGVINEIETSNRTAGSFGTFAGTQTFTPEGLATNANGYFAVTIEPRNLTPNACRYFLTLRWPAMANTNSPMAQVRTFVSDQVRTW